MTLDPDDAERFINLHKALNLFVNQRLKLGQQPPESQGIVALRSEQRLKVRDALVEHRDLIDAFAEANPYKLDPDDLAIIRSWKNFVAGEFAVLRFLKKHTIFLTTTEPAIAYGVLGLTEPLSEVISQPLPYFCKTMLLPFRNRIVYDGILFGYNVLIGRNMTRQLTANYSEAKKENGIVTRLPWNHETQASAPKRVATRKKKGKKQAGLHGQWRIVWMENWDQDFVDEEVEAYVRFDRNGRGEFQFGYVHGDMDCREGERDGKPGVEFTWEGNDEMDPVQGRGWAVLNDEELEGMIFIHRGDESAVRAVRKGKR